MATHVTRADRPASERTTAIVHATGKTGSIEPVRSTDREALAPEVQAGAISRAALNAELARGPGRFLQNVKVEAVLSHGHFVGWRVLALFPRRPEVHVQVLKPGDVVLRINGASLEHPEDFKEVFDGLANAKELVLEIERDGQPSTLHINISDV